MTYIVLPDHDLSISHYRDGSTSIYIYEDGVDGGQALALDARQSERAREELNKFQPETVPVPEGWTKQDVLDAIEAYSPTPEWAGADFLRATGKLSDVAVRFVRVRGEGADSTYIGFAGTMRTVGEIADHYTDITVVG